MNIILAVVIFALGVGLGAFIVHKKEELIVSKLLNDCAECRNKLKDMIKEEETFIESMWPKPNPHITMETNLVDYLRQKYLQNEFEPDCEDESDNLYM